MAILGGTVGYRLLRWIRPEGDTTWRQEKAYLQCNKLEALFGPSVWQELADKVVIDFGCGAGAEAIEAARRGARRVIGVDIRESVLELARHAAALAGVSSRCHFTTVATEKADVILSIDAFEHFDDPKHVLHILRELIHDDGRALITFGPPWYHPRGGHTFSVFPWAHLLFSEKSLLRWRADFKADGAKRFKEVAGGLNQMTIRRFERLVQESAFEFASFEAVPIRKLRYLANPLTREYLASYVRCRLRPR